MLQWMRVVLSAVFLVAAGAVEVQAVSLPFTGSLTIEVASFTSAPPVVTVPGSGVAIVNGSGPGGHLASVSLAGSSFAATAQVVPVTDPVVFPIKGLLLTVHNGAGAIVGGGGAIPLAGALRVCLFAACSAPPPGNLSVPLSVVGAGGTQTFPGGAVLVTVFGAPWTTGTATVGTLTRMGFARGPASATSSAAAPSGSVQLVTPIFIVTSLAADNILPGFATLTLHFIPEPTTTLLVGAGIGGLAAVDRLRQR